MLSGNVPVRVLMCVCVRMPVYVCAWGKESCIFLRLLPDTNTQAKLKIDFPQMTLPAKQIQIQYNYRYRYRYKYSHCYSYRYNDTDTDTNCVCPRRNGCLSYLMDTFGRVTIYNSTRCTTLVVCPISQYCLPLLSKLNWNVCKCLYYLSVMYVSTHTHTHTLESISPPTMFVVLALWKSISLSAIKTADCMHRGTGRDIYIEREWNVSKLQIIKIYV